MTPLDDDILDALREQDLEVAQLRAELARRGHRPSHEGLYGRLVHLEGQARLRVLTNGHETRSWGALERDQAPARAPRQA
jgi:hypothetical protein